MPETNLNPFTSEDAASAYAGTDPVYEASARAAIEFVAPNAASVADLGAGTGVSAQIILNAMSPGSCLSLIEPSKAMLEFARARLGDKANYINASAEELCASSFDIIYAMNCWHLFPDHQQAALSIARALKPEGLFVFNLSSPSYRFTELSADELDVLYANLDFYAGLHSATASSFAVLGSTVQLLSSLVTSISYSGRESDIIEGLGISAAEFIKRSGTAGLYTKAELVDIFKAANMVLDASTELIIEVPAQYQRNIWRMMARSFMQDDRLIEELVMSVVLPEIVPIRQVIFKLCKY